MYQTSLSDAQTHDTAEPLTPHSATITYPAQWHNAAPGRLQFLSAALAHRWVGPILLLLAAFTVRGIWFGDPVVQIDEQFYLLVGDRLLHGAIPYVDVWDRKPIGLFLIYAGIRLLGGSGILEYQIVATLFAWGTALIVTRIARSVASPHAAWIAGIVYLLWLNMFTGQGGQSPVFYNLFVAGAGLLTLRATGHGTATGTRLRLGAAAMALCGIAMQIKYTAMFEGMFFGLALCWAQWRETRRLDAMLGAGLGWMAIALAPSAAVLAFYASIHQEQAFLYANVLSVMRRGNVGTIELLQRLGMICLLLSPLLISLAWSEKVKAWRGHARHAHNFLLFWFGAAVIGLLVFGTYYDHYALPLLVSLSAGIAPLFDHVRGTKRIGLWVAGVLAAIGVIATGVGYRIVTSRKGNADYIAQVVATIEANRHGGSLYLYEGEPVLYLFTGAPAPTKFLFPNHLDEAIEGHAIGVDPVAEEKRILATKPQVIVDGSLRPQYRTPERERREFDFLNRATRAVLDPVLLRDYRLVAQFPLKKRYRRIWVRRQDAA
jgi:4-amino-4-deoxy-L-arabinose transferase-like glycosyltransferase